MNQFFDSVLIALQAVWANKLRSFMTVLGNIVAVTSIVTVVSLVQGMNGYVTSAILTDVGGDTFVVQRRPPIRTDEEDERSRNNPIITLDEADAIQAFSPVVHSVMAQTSRTATVGYGTEELENIQIQGVTASYLNFSTFDAERGRMMSAVEVDRAQPVTLVGYEIADRLFGKTNPIGKSIRVAGISFRVVGVSKKKGGFFGQSQDAFVIIPLGSYIRLFGGRQSLTLVVKPESPEVLQAAIDDATVALRVKRRLKPSDPDTFGIFTSSTILNLYERATSGIFGVLIGVVALSLVVGGIVIMNIMLMVVSERTREIGLRKALGARRADIMSQVLTESVTLSVFGGIVGIALGMLASHAIASISPLPAYIAPWSVVVAILITAGVGLFFGAYPASRAASLDPIEALRRE